MTSSNDKIRQRVHSNYAAFIDNVDPDRLSDYLKQEDIISIAQCQELCGKHTTSRSRCRALLDFLLSGTHPRAFLVVRSVLEKDNHHLLGAIDDVVASCLTEDRKTINIQLQRQVESIQVLERRLREADGENDKLRKTVDELRTKLDNCQCQHDGEMQSSRTGLEISAMRKVSTDGQERETEPCGAEQKSATLKPRRRKTYATNSASLRSTGRRAPLGSKQYDRTDPYMIKEIKTRASTDNGKAIHGLALLDAELFIISRLSSDVEVLDADRLIFLRIITLKILEAPWDIVSCKINKCFYIMNWKEDQTKTIVRLHPNGMVIKEWSTGRNCGRISITQDSNVILAAYKTDTIVEYTAEGGLVREIKLSYTMANTQHAIKFNNGNYLVIHGMYDDILQRVCLLDGTGNIQASFGGEKEPDREQLQGPIYLVVDSTGTIVVAEYLSSRVVLLNQSLQFKRVLLSKEKHGLRDPWSIHLDEGKGRLFLVDNEYQQHEKQLKDGRVLVFYINRL